MPSGNVKVKLRVGANEVEIEGSLLDIEKTVTLIPEMIKTLPKQIQQQNSEINIPKNIPESILQNYMIRPNINKYSQLSKFPEINVDKGDSLSDIIIKIFLDDWGRNPRKLGEIREALQSYGQVYPKQSVAVALLRLAQSGRLRRFKGEGGEYVYTASTSLTADESERIATIKV